MNPRAEDSLMNRAQLVMSDPKLSNHCSKFGTDIELSGSSGFSHMTVNCTSHLMYTGHSQDT
jgi:hypothetical protein